MTALVKRAQNILRESCGENPGLLLVACSGGRDSLALAAVSRETYHHVGALIINHQLQDGSREVAEEAARICRERGLDPVQIVDIHVERTRTGLEADARDARYDALSRVSREMGASAVLVAHTQDDVAETILMKLLRGAGVNALNGIASRVEHDGVPFLRPFLSLSRADTTRICDELGLAYWDDPTNGDSVAPGELLPEDFPLRSKMRHDILPLLSTVTHRDAVEVLAGSVDEAREDLEIIDTAVAEAYRACTREKEGRLELKIRALNAQLPAVQRRVIARFIAENGQTPTRAMIQAVAQLRAADEKKKTVQLKAGLAAYKMYNVIQLWKDSKYANF
ncbi:tRNA lysidine(34) synthetase TilS [Alloscardovia macacae]|uniref:tRNA(Ile)-lysidine synthase n=1 Tax=Alloscardovia macacae TaxID=1160091 RepID=A0A1Y2SVA3_9BIFI|nr:tRNA lysidine(34) synthetase TilS [Alloscardovia macacae]OTA26096.1 tRNA lysidine(34) synthetase TilS [Alloscardovia macacae]OTA28603.1 tRNA lysidine(34) synthetase TilS [Alloscardovia macacae]